MTTTTVNTASGLIAALRSAHAGDTILLAAGTYNGVGLNNLNFSSAVTIQSADPTHQAVINNLVVSGSSGLAFNQVHFATVNDWAATVVSSHNVTFTNDTFQGASSATGNAMMIRASDNVTVTGSDFGKLWSGINQLTANNVTITNNTFHDLSNAAIRGTGATNETISGNTFADAKASVADHSDVVYLWQDNTANHVSITGNTYGASSAPPVTTPPVTTPPVTTPPVTTPPVTTPPASTHGATVTVSNTNELWTALQHAHGGDTILLKAGTYDAVGVYNLNFSSAVTIQSADPAHQAVINNLDVEGSSNVVFNQLHLTTTTGAAATVASSSHDITFTNDTFQGTVAGSGSAMLIRNADHVTVTGSDIGKFWSGVNETTASNVTITNNTFHDLTAEGVRGTGATYETISGNTFANANPNLANHQDAIYLWQDNTANHVTISGNTFGSGATTPPVTTPPVTTPPVTTPPVTTPPSTGSGASTGSNSSAGTGSGPQTVTVGSVSDLNAALKSAHAGDTILLKAGTYDGVGIYGFNYNGAVTIQSADPTHQAVINNLDIEQSSGIAIKNVNVEVTGTTANAVMVGTSSHISLDGLTIYGTSTTLTGTGVFVRNSNDVTLSNSDISQLGSGVGHLDDSGLTILNNNIHNIEADGIIGGGSSHVTVSGNTFSDFHTAAGDHPDAIQFFGGDLASSPSTDILVSNNVITRGDGSIIQGIFVENTSNIVITGNAMAGTMTNGIAVSASPNTLISGNFLDGFTDMGTEIVTRGASANVTVVGNTTQGVLNYAGDGVNANYLESGNTAVAPTAVGDLSALKAWLAAHVGVTAALTGGAGSDVLTGTAGADTMSGGFGDDVYQVNNVGDVVNEAANAGIDTVKSSIATYTLGANVENLSLVGTTAQTGIGNSLNNVITSNGVQASLNGGAGADTLIATGNADTLTGGAGNDVFSIAKVPTTPVLITDFTAGQDKLDLHTLLANYHGSNPLTDNWVQFQATSTGLNVLVDVDGPTGSAGFVAVAKLAGVNSLAATDWVFH